MKKILNGKNSSKIDNKKALMNVKIQRCFFHAKTTEIKGYKHTKTLEKTVIWALYKVKKLQFS